MLHDNHGEIDTMGIGNGYFVHDQHVYGHTESKYIEKWVWSR